VVRREITDDTDSPAVSLRRECGERAIAAEQRSTWRKVLAL
jgi:hypothetical protein